MPLILMVEDNEDNRFVYRTILEHHGFEVIETMDGKTGVAAARARVPDLILLDISMPVMDGWAAFDLIRHDPVTAAIPIVALTAHALNSDEVKAVELGFDAFIRKPAPPLDVVAVVRRLLESRS